MKWTYSSSIFQMASCLEKIYMEYLNNAIRKENKKYIDDDNIIIKYVTKRPNNVYFAKFSRKVNGYDMGYI